MITQLKLSELNVEKARLEIKVNQMQDELAETKKMFFERRKLLATIKRFNVQGREKIEKLRTPIFKKSISLQFQ